MTPSLNFSHGSQHKQRWRPAAAALLLGVALLAGCATTKTSSSEGGDSLATYFREADVQLAGGQRDKAIHALNQAAKEYPTSTAPWLKMANVWFEAGNYPSSILAANEVLQRDASNQEAKSLLIVAGLRVAAGAVAGLRPTGSAGTSARAEAEKLTQSLREALGETVLVPAPSESEAKQANAPVKPKVKKRIRAVIRPTESTASDTSAAGPSDPFKSLK